MRSDAAERRARILRTARHLIAQHGADIALEAIASASEVGIATLYRNFASREELLAAVASDIVESIVAAADACAESAADDPETAWRELIAALVQLELGALTDAIASGLSAESRVAVTRLQRRAVASITAALHALRGAVRDDLTAEALITGIAIITRPQPALQRAADQVVDDLVDAYLAWTLRGAHRG